MATDVRRRLVARVGDDPGGGVALLATRGVAACEPYLTRYLPALVLALVLPPLAVAAIATQDLLSAGIVLVTLPLVPVFAALVGLATRDRAERQWRELGSLAGHFVDVVKGLPTLVVFGRAEAQSTRIRVATERYRRASAATLRLAFASSAVLELVATLSVALVAVSVGLRVADGGLDLRTALVVLLLAPEAYWPLRRVGAEFHAAAEGVATFEQVAAVLDAPVADHPRAHEATRVGSGPLRVRGLTLLHPGRTIPVLDHLDADLPERGLTVVVGPSGCGKSTLLAVLAGLLPATAGHVDRVAADPAWQRRVAWLPQRPGFVAGTVGDNLRLGQPGAGDVELWAALRRVALEERVRDLPAGLDTDLAEDGASLSAGERARLALARVVVADRPWVLLDEPTAHLDDLTEQVVADTLVDLARSRAVVVVTHRPALVGLADHVVRVPAPPPSISSLSVPPVPVLPAPVLPAPAPRPAAGEGPRPDPSRAAGRLGGLGGLGGLGAATVLGSLASASGVALTATAGWLLVRASEQPPVLTLMVAIVGVRAFGLARPALRWAERLRAHDVVLGMLAEQRARVYDLLVPLTPGALGRRRGDVLASVVDDVDSVLDRELRERLPVRSAVLVVVLASVVASLVRWPAGLVVAGGGAGAALLAHAVARRGAARAEAGAVATRARLAEHVVEAVDLGEELRLWQARGRAADRVAADSEDLGRDTVRAATALATGRAVVLVAAAASTAALALLLAPAVADGALDAPRAALLLLLPLALTDVLLPVADAGAVGVRTRAARERLDALAALAPRVLDPPRPRPAPEHPAVVLHRVGAGWGEEEAVGDLDLRLPPGRRVAVVGPSGSGKSTLAALLLRFLDPSTGRVLLDTVDLRSLALHDVRRTVGLVDDSPHVFASTLVENVRLARPDADDDRVEAALRAARLGPWLDALPDGLHTWLGEGHAGVSGGERARLGVARALLADPPVLVLDEPTAHLDEATAADLAREVLGPDGRAAGAGRTVVWITHGSAGVDLVDDVVHLGRHDGPPRPDPVAETEELHRG
ncbi:thiol reductant ABC exporter subunit CydD [Nocardioides sp. Leaf307]|uniref:thiol reductant ABC exporter subunit CydD n=1 Tax=Nocardioides sp. Leaf307 TaxID=1736331 RepID=UPI000A57D419|nr:thiol reductant ABC exporter subunit CydD [Nocardioides sp. Leaf307]